MRCLRLLLSTTLAATAVAVWAVSASSSASGAPARAVLVPSGREQADFAAAASESGAPTPLLLALSYAQTLWEGHNGQPSTAGGYGPMHLVDVVGSGSRGEPAAVAGGRTPLEQAATLIAAPASVVRGDERQNIRAGAALLASYARSLNDGRLPAAISDWYGAVAKYSGATDESAAQEFADDVYSTLRTGAAATTQDGQLVRLPAQPAITPNRAGLSALHLQRTKTVSAAECPRGLDCRFIPAAYAQNSASVGDYGNYDTANRPTDLKIHYIVIHDTELGYDDTVALFQNPKDYASAHYVIRSSDGQVTQMIHTKDVSWQAGNWYINMHSIGVEHEGYAIQGASWYTETLYRSSARLVRYLAARFDVPLDRAHIIGHDNVPGGTPADVAGMHWDTGPFWDWAHYMQLLGAPIRPTGRPGSDVVTIAPRFATNQPTVTGCGTPDVCPAQGTSFVYLHTAPSDSAPLLSDPALHPDGSPGTTSGSDTGDKASAGDQFVVAGRAPGWTAIWYGGQRAWFRDARSAPTTVPATARTVSPRAGAASAPVYGRAYPEAAAYPADIPVQAVTPLQYSIASGQRYVLGDRTPIRADYYYAKTIDSSLPGDHTVVRGSDLYYEIYFGHRMAFVRAADVVVH